MPQLSVRHRRVKTLWAIGGLALILALSILYERDFIVGQTIESVSGSIYLAFLADDLGLRCR